MKFKNTPHISVLLLLVLITSCTGRRYYTAEKLVTPLFNEKHQFYVDVSGNPPIGANLECGYSFADNYSFMIGSGFAKENQFDPFGSIDYYSSDNSFLSFGLGYFINKKANRLYNFESFFNYTRGKYNVYHSVKKTSSIQNNDYSLTNGQYHKFSLQCNVGNRLDKNMVKWAYSLKLGNVNYTQPNMTMNGLPAINYPIDWKKPYFTLEHGLSLKFGYRDLKLQVQWQFNHGLFLGRETDAIRQMDHFFYLGFVLMPGNSKWIDVD